MILEISDLEGWPGLLGYMLYYTLANSCWYNANADSDIQVSWYNVISVMVALPM